MTLNTRNKLLLFFSIASSLCAAVFTAVLIWLIIKKPQHISLLFTLPQGQSFFRLLITPNYTAAFFSLLIFSFFVPAVSFSVYFNFEKTQSLEVLFFCSALIGVLTESFKLCIPLFGITAGYSGFLRFLGQAAFFGQMEILLSIITQGVLAAGGENRDSDKYLGIIIIIALIFSTTIPLNTTVFENYMHINYGFKNLFGIIRIVFILCTFLILFFSPKSKESLDYKRASVDFLLICGGYIALLHCNTFVILAVGIPLLFAGTVHFLKNMHKYYMWK
ncbi:hypothetical protein H0R92_09905 [Treponema sp. OMZ 840]|uniref:hypothetical protein n=1 Tax=Treponema sp. OMZ 840 TaxID=244313 RepID=UPI003D89C8FB